MRYSGLVQVWCIVKKLLILCSWKVFKFWIPRYVLIKVIYLFFAFIIFLISFSRTHLHIVLCERIPTPGSLRSARALPTSHCVASNLIRLCLKCSANISNNLKINKSQMTKYSFNIVYPHVCYHTTSYTKKIRWLHGWCVMLANREQSVLKEHLKFDFYPFSGN